MRGSKVLHEAELARVHRATVREAKDAWGGRAVGHIDEPDTFVEFRVFAASPGAHTLTVRYGNGSLDASGAPAAATHTLTVNGASAGSVDYPYTGWDAWQPREVEVELREGWNTVRLAKGESFTELDAVEWRRAGVRPTSDGWSRRTGARAVRRPRCHRGSRGTRRS